MSLLIFFTFKLKKKSKS